ncbi:MAG: hypothetical protein HY000_20360 [Planctomycetes bacterium]|nr:hypothetical protein [Planctomycetota bacterium]
MMPNRKRPTVMIETGHSLPAALSGNSRMPPNPYRSPEEPSTRLQFGLRSLFWLTLAAAVFLALGREHWSNPLLAVLCQTMFGLAYVAGIGLAVAMWIARRRH